MLDVMGNEDAQFLGLSQVSNNEIPGNIYRQIIDLYVNLDSDDIDSGVGIDDLEYPLEDYIKNGLDSFDIGFSVGNGFSAPENFIKKESNIEILATRGYLTRVRLDALQEVIPVGDLGLLAKVQNQDIQRDGTLVVVNSLDECSELLLEELALKADKIIDLRSGLETLVRSIESAEYVFSSQVVALAISDVAGTPNAWLKDSRISGDSQFTIMDYFSAVERNLSESCTYIPNTELGKQKKTTCAQREIVMEKQRSLLAAVYKLHENSKKVGWNPQLDAPLALSVGEAKVIDFETPVNNIEMKFSVVSSADVEKYYLISYQLKSDFEIDINDLKKQDLWKSDDDLIGYFSYINVRKGNNSSVVRVSLPVGVQCSSIKIIKWSKSEENVTLSQVSFFAR